MPKLVEIPKNLKPYVFHGLALDEQGKQAIGDCPFCGREGKFSVNIESGVWRCLICAEGSEKGGGNVYTFLRALHKASDKATTDYSEILQFRKLLYPETLMLWGVCKSILKDEWIIPGYNGEGKLTQLFRYARNPHTGRHILLATPELPMALFGPTINSDCPEVFLCEGPWDGMAAWETMRYSKRINGDNELQITGNPAGSLLAQINVLATPGCNVFQEGWAPLFAGKKVSILFDNDHPRVVEKTGKITRAGYDGAKRVANTLASAEEAPESISFLQWGPEGHDPELPSGYDIRDAITSMGSAPSERIKGLAAGVLSRIEPIPDNWITGRSKANSKKGSVEIELLPCRSWGTLTDACRKALKWTHGLESSLAVMLSAILSTETAGDQLWVKIIGPASCGKSVLCEAISVCKKYIIAKSTLRGFHSGYRESNDETEDNSLIALCANRTLVTKDGDTLLQAPNVTQILSEARDIYDRASRTHYRNKASKDYEGISMTWILCGTSSLRALDSSELGERFLDCVVVDEIDEELEDEIAWRVATRAARDVSYKLEDLQGVHREGPEMTLMKQLTGGYIIYLRENAHDLLSAIPDDEEPLRQCASLARFVAYMRARPSKKQKEKAEREMSYRLTSQMVRLAKCLAVVMDRRTIDEDVMARVTKVALDTARGRTLELARHLYNVGENGAPSHDLAIWTNHIHEEEKELLRFMRKIGAVENFTLKAGASKQTRWRLTARLRSLYERCM